VIAHEAVVGWQPNHAGRQLVHGISKYVT